MSGWTQDPKFFEQASGVLGDSLALLTETLLGYGVPAGQAERIAGQMGVACAVIARLPTAASIESPVESLFMVAVYPYAFSERISILPQQEFGPYRADFVLERGDRRLVVEIDGHDYHERTKEQSSRDKKRDRWFMSQGIRVVRFTGSDVWRDAQACAREAVGILLAGGWGDS